jgi:hypothetical protein
MDLSKIFTFGSKSSGTVSSSEIPEIYPLAVNKTTFINSDILSTYHKILTDTVERAHGLTEKYQPALWDNCLQSETSEGLVTLLADAMTHAKDLFIVFVPSISMVRRATHKEQEEIRKDYKEKGESPKGVYVSFTKYRRTEMLRIYSEFEYCVLSGLNKKLNISKALQIKISELRMSTALVDADVAINQAKSIAEALRNGNDVLLDQKDTIETATPDTSTSEKAIGFLDSKKAFVLALPIAYVTGLQTGGIGASGENDMRAVERGLKQYFVSIIQPVFKALFQIETEFKSQDFRQMTTALDVLKTFDLVSDENMSRESKKEIIARVFDLDPEAEKKALAKQEKEDEDEEVELPFTPQPIVRPPQGQRNN